MPLDTCSASASLPRPLPWSPENYPAGLMFPPGICLWADDNAPEDTVVAVDGQVIGSVTEAQLGPFGHVVQVDGKVLVGYVEAWRSGDRATDPALSAHESSDTLPA